MEVIEIESLPATIVSEDATEFILRVVSKFSNPDVKLRRPTVATMEVITGDFQFSVGKPVNETSTVYTDTNTDVITFGYGYGDLYVKADGAAKSFKLSE